jgi:mannobiose 2-epimerase
MESIAAQKTDFVRELNDELTLNILPFWSNKMIDTDHGGFIGRIDGRDIKHLDSTKGGVLNGRILWTFSSAFLYSREPRYLLLAQRSFDYLLNHFIDQEKGGIYWMLDYRGNPINSKKQIYALAFAIYGLSEFYRASGNLRALEEAISLYQHIEEHSFDREYNGYFEAFDRNWKMMDDLRLSDKDANEKKTMNTHLHILEAYTLLYMIWPDLKLKARLTNLIELFLEKFLNEYHHYNLFFDEYWVLKSDIVSYGHDIEGTWLVYEAARVLQEDILIQKTGEAAIRMVDKTMQIAFDDDGGLMYEGSPDKVEDTDKHWWPQAEAMVGLVNAWQLTNDSKYLESAVKTWSFIKEKIIDRRNGEWFFRVDKAGNPNYEEDKAGPWKCPYHNSRACFEIIRRLNP